MILGLDSKRAWLMVLVAASLAAYFWAGSSRLSNRRVWDERYSLWNVEEILRTGSPRPTFAWYPGLSHLPQTAVLGASHAVYKITGNESFAVLRPEKGMRPLGYLLSRWTNALSAAGCLVLTFVAGRRLFSPETGLLAAFLLATSLWQIRTAAIYKPDAPLMLFTLVAFLLSLRAVERAGAEKSGFRPYLLAGLGVGLAASTKQTGALSSIPLVAGTLFFPNRWRWLWLAAAGMAAVVIFLVFNPFPDLLPDYLDMGSKYRGWAATQEGASPSLLRFAMFMTIDPRWHGPWVGTATLVGLAGLILEAWRSRRERLKAVRLAMFLSLPIGFPLACAAVSDFPKTNIFFPLLPFTSLAAAWFIVKLWSWISSRMRAPVRRLVFWPALLLLAAQAVYPASVYIYREAVHETTLQSVGESLPRLAPFPDQRTVIHEGGVEQLDPVRRFSSRSWVRVWPVEVESLSEVVERELALADFEVFPEERLHGPGGDFYLERLRLARPDGLAMVDPKFLRRRGRSQVVVAHPWHPVGAAVPIEWRGTGRRRPLRSLRAPAPPQIESAEAVSFDLLLPEEAAEACRFSVGGRELALFPYRAEGKRRRWMTRRFRPIAVRGRLRFECEEGGGPAEAPQVSVWRWSELPVTEGYTP